MKTVLGIFGNENSAETAVNRLKNSGYDPKDISVVMKDRAKGTVTETKGSEVGKDTASGVTAGAVIGGIAGLLVGVGAVTIPGIGAFLIAGPIATALGLTWVAATTASGAVTGAVAGGIVGALVGLGVPEEQAESYGRRINEGGILVAVPAREGDERNVAAILRDNNAGDIKTLSLNDKYRRENPENEEVSERYSRLRYSHKKDDGHHVVNPIQVEKFLKDIDYPAEKQELIDSAKKEGANDDVIHTLDVMPGRKFKSPNDVSQAIGKID